MWEILSGSREQVILNKISIKVGMGKPVLRLGWGCLISFLTLKCLHISKIWLSEVRGVETSQEQVVSLPCLAHIRRVLWKSQFSHSGSRRAVPRPVPIERLSYPAGAVGDNHPLSQNSKSGQAHRRTYTAYSKMVWLHLADIQKYCAFAYRSSPYSLIHSDTTTFFQGLYFKVSI